MKDSVKVFMINAYHLVDAVPAAFFGIVALWVSGSRRHWFIRTTIMGALLLLMLLIPAYEVLLQFCVEVLVVVGAMSLWRRLRRNRNRPDSNETEQDSRRHMQVSLETMFLLTAVIAVVTAVIARAPRLAWYQWLGWISNALLAAVVTLSSVWLVYGKSHWLWRLLATPVLVGLLGLAMLWLRLANGLLQLWVYSVSEAQRYWQSLVVQGLLLRVGDTTKTVAIGMLVIIAWLYLMRVAGWFDPFREVPKTDLATIRPRGQLAARFAALVAFALIGLVPLYLFYRLLTPSPIPELAGPRPSGYDELLAAGRMVRGFKPNGLFSMGPLSNAQLSEAVATNSEAIAKAHAALTSECQFPLVDSTGQHFLPQDEFQALLSISQMLYGRWMLASRVGTPGERVSTSLDLLWFSFHEAHGNGTEEFQRIGQFEFPALDTLWQVRGKLNDQECRALLNELVRLDSGRATWDSCVERQRIIDENSGWQIHLSSMVGQWSSEGREVYSHDLLLTRLTQMRVLLLDLAVRAFQFDHGRLPNALEELVSAHLPAIPEDPFAKGKPLRVRVDGNTFQIYSVGANGVDDGGQPKRLIPSLPARDLTEAVLFSLPANPPATTPPSKTTSTDDGTMPQGELQDGDATNR